MRRTKLIKRFFVYAVARCVAAALLLLPLGIGLAIGALAGRIAYLVASRDRRRAIAQLRDALGLEDGAARRIARRAFVHIGMVAAEIAVLPRLRRRLEAYVELAEPDRALLRDTLAQGRGVIFVSAHLGNWELLAQRIALEGHDAVTLARRSSNPYLAGWLVARRIAGRVETINRGEPRAARRILSALRRGAILGVLLDQDTHVDSLHVPFFGKPASTPTAAADLALHGDIPVLCGFIERKPNSPGHRIRLERVDLSQIPASEKDERIFMATAHLTQIIERAVQARPDEWVWFHARWKTPTPSRQGS